MLGAERQSARMLKITDDDLTRCGTGCFIAMSIGRVHRVLEKSLKSP